MDTFFMLNRVGPAKPKQKVGTSEEIPTHYLLTLASHNIKLD